MEKNIEHEENWRIWKKIENSEKTEEYRGPWGISRNLGNMQETQTT